MYLKKGFPLRVLFCLMALYFIYAIERDVSDGDVTTSTKSYTKEESPSTYNIQISKKIIFVGVCLVFAFIPYKSSKKD
jgi:hypothetical protein